MKSGVIQGSGSHPYQSPNSCHKRPGTQLTREKGIKEDEGREGGRPRRERQAGPCRSSDQAGTRHAQQRGLRKEAGSALAVANIVCGRVHECKLAGVQSVWSGHVQDGTGQLFVCGVSREHADAGDGSALRSSNGVVDSSVEFVLEH